MKNWIVNLLSAPVFPEEAEKTRRARTLNVLYLNIGAALLVAGILGIPFIFEEKFVISIILVTSLALVVIGMALNRRGHVKASGLLILAPLWFITTIMACISGGIRSFDILLFVSGTVVAGISLGAEAALVYAGLSLFVTLGMVVAAYLGIVFPQVFTFPPASIWIILLTSLLFALGPLQVTLRSLSNSILRTEFNEQRYRMIASVMSDFVFSIRYGPGGEIEDQWLGGAFEALTGYTPEEYFERGGWLTILHPDDREEEAQNVALLRANQKVVSEMRILKKDGSVRWMRTYGHPLWDEKRGQLAGIYGAVQDVTERRWVEADVRQRADEVSLLYHISLALTSGQDLYHALRAFVSELRRVMIVDAFHVGLYDAETDLFTYSVFMNLDQDMIFPPRSLREKPGLTWEVISRKRTLYLPDILEPQAQKDHKVIFIVDVGMRAYIGIPLVIEDRVIGIMSVQSLQPNAYTPAQIRLLETLAAQVAITIERLHLLEQLQAELKERERLERELHEERDFALQIINTMGHGLTVTDKDGCFLLVNPAYANLIGFEPQELIGRQPADITYVEDQGILNQAVADRQEGKTTTYETNVHHRDGTLIPILVTGAPRIKDGKYAGAIASITDLTAIKKAEAEREKLIAELTAINAELERFTYTVSHDLRSPLVTIKGFLGYLEKDALQGNMESFRKDMQRVSSATDRMDELLKELLELSRIGRLVNKPAEVPFETLVNEALEIVHGALEARRAAVEVHPNLPTVFVDKPRLVEVLQNLVDNAVKYMGDQKFPLIEIGMAGHDETDNPVFFVRDNGIGIPAKYHERIFRLFDKLDAKSESTGVGLAIVKRIIEFHAGKIWVESEVGKGSTFYFTLGKRETPPTPKN